MWTEEVLYFSCKKQECYLHTFPSIFTIFLVWEAFWQNTIAEKITFSTRMFSLQHHIFMKKIILSVSFSFHYMAGCIVCTAFYGNRARESFLCAYEILQHILMFSKSPRFACFHLSPIVRAYKVEAYNSYTMVMDVYKKVFL